MFDGEEEKMKLVFIYKNAARERERRGEEDSRRGFIFIFN